MASNNDKMPQFDVRPDVGLFEVSGRSYPENAAEVFEPFIASIKEYLENPLPKTTLNVRLELCNTSTSKMLIYIFQLMDQVKEEKNVETIINWYIKHDDEDELQLADDMKLYVESEFNVFVKN